MIDMETIEVKLDRQTLERAQQVAALRHSTLEALIKSIIEQLAEIQTVDDPLLGMFADEPKLIDHIVESAMEAREVQPLTFQTTAESIPPETDIPHLPIQSTPAV
jgi:hypothetical protein